MICYNPPHMDDVQTSKKKMPSKKEWRGFYSLILIQAQNAFNEKAAQFLLIPLGVWLASTNAAYGPDSWVNSLQYILACIFVLPYILFSPFVGWLADCFCKARIIQFMSFLQILVLGAMLLCYKYENIEMAVFWFCVFSVQATILSPAKKGVVKDMVGSRQLGYASGLMEMSLILSMLAAQIGIFAWFDILQVSSNDGWEAAAFPTFILTCIAVPVAIASLYLPRYPANQTRKFEWKLFYEHFVQLKYLWSQRDLRLSEIGVSYFWFLAGALMLISLQIAQEHPIDGTGFSMSAAILMAWLSGGTVVGGVIASIICRKKIELGLIPLGAIGFTIGCIFMSFFAPGSLPSNIGFGITGAFAAAYLVPLNAHLQDNCDPSNRSTVIAAGNLMDCLMGLVAVGFQLMLRNIFSLQIAQEHPIDGTGFSMSAAILMAWLSGGTVVGGVIASIICRKKIELGLIPLGAIGFTIGCIFMSFFAPGSLPSNIGFGITGAFAAAYLVPLNAHLQDNCDPSNRSTVIAAGNLMDCLMGLVAVGFQLMLRNIFSIQNQFWVLAALGVVITIVAFRLIPREFIRMMGLWIMRIVYRSRIIHQDRIPEDGGAVIVSNHVTYGDALFLSLICPRPIRFIVAEEFVAIRWLGWILELFNCLPISSRNPRESLSKAIQALKAGEVICIFPEGQLTRTGTLCAARRGLEMLAKKSRCPIVPIYMDELWGSIFSYSGNRFFSKAPLRVPYRFTAAIGEPIEPDAVNPRMVINTLRELSSTCLEIAASIGRDAILNHLERIAHKPLVFSKNARLSGYEIAECLMNDTVEAEHPELRKWLSTLLDSTRSQSRLCDFWMNAQQLERVNSLQPRELLLTSVGREEVHETVAAVLWPILTSTPVYLISDGDHSMPEGIRQIAGSDFLRRRLYSLVPNTRTPFYDFSGSGDLVLPNIGWRPCFATDRGIILAMSMKRSVFKLDDGTVQLGMRARTRGRLLPGFYLNPPLSNVIAGATLSTPYSLPPNLYLDESGFLAELQSSNHEQ